MAIAIANEASTTHYNAGGGDLSFSVAMTSSGTGRVMVVVLSQSGQDNLISPVAPASVKFNGVSLTQFDIRNEGFQAMMIYYLLTPDSVTDSIVVDISNNNLKFNRWTLHALQFSDADDSGLGATQQGTSVQGPATHIDVILNRVAAEGYIVAAVTWPSNDPTSLTPAGVQDLELSGADINWSPNAAYHHFTDGPGNETLSFNYATNKTTTAMGIEIKGVVSAAGNALFMMT